MEQSYKEKYEQAIERLKQWDREHPCAGYVLSDRDKFIFPELAESEDENIKKRITLCLEECVHSDVIRDYEKDECIAWLEKQGQVKESTISQHENRTCEENGNSLTYEDERIRKEIINYFQCQNEEEPTRKEIHNKWIAWLENIPVTIDHEKREGFHLGYRACLERQGEQKPEENKGNIGGISHNWSEEDERNLQGVIDEIEANKNQAPDCDLATYDRFLSWLKSLKGRVQLQNKWKPSDVQIECLSDAIKHYNSLGYPASKLKELLDDLKKLNGGEI